MSNFIMQEILCTHCDQKKSNFISIIQIISCIFVVFQRIFDTSFQYCSIVGYDPYAFTRAKFSIGFIKVFVVKVVTKSVMDFGIVKKSPEKLTEKLTVVKINLFFI